MARPMTDTQTFEDLARAAARDGAAAECADEASALEERAAVVPAPRSEALLRAARGLRVAARILAATVPGSAPRVQGFGRTGLKGALAAGHLALAKGRPAQAELIGDAVHEASSRSPAGLRLVGQALFAQGRYRPAVRAFRGAVAVDPKDAYTRALHAEALWFAGECEVALAALGGLKAAGGAGGALAAALEEAFRCRAIPRKLPCARWTAP